MFGSHPRRALAAFDHHLRGAVSVVLCACGLALSAPAWAQEVLPPPEPVTPTAVPMAPPRASVSDLTFWRPDVPGSDSQFQPLQVWINGGWDILRNPSYQDRIHRVEYGTGLANIVDQVRDLPSHAERIGFGNFASRELFPFRGLDTKYGAFVPNWFMHTLGEGMLMRKLQDWYTIHDYSYPRVAALSTLVLMQVTNEVTENGGFRGSNADPIADLLIYNPLGYILFSIDEVAALFGPKGPMTTLYWPGQAALVPGTWRLVNQGENFAFHIGRGLPGGLRGFMYYGKQGLFGVVVPLGKSDHLSLGVGPSLRGLTAVFANGVRTMEPGGDLSWEVGTFWDHEGSLLASAVAGVVGDHSLHLNLYPGLLPALGGLQFGAFARWGLYDGWFGGVSLSTSPIGLAAAGAKPNEATLFR